MIDNILKTKDYPIILTDDAGEKLDDFLNQRTYSSIYVLMDENIMENCWPILSRSSAQAKNAEILVIDSGEAQKDIEIVFQLWQTLTEYQADRSSLLINFGGGVISDLGGFVASTYKRGIDFVNIPTSLLSMVDASVGGKTGVNLLHYKNQIGVFNQPQAIFVQANFLETLDDRQIMNGFAEMLKHGLIADSQHWKSLIKLVEITAETIAPFIARSIEIKKEIVEQDPLEKNIRKSLNFGHTIGHLMESWSLENDKNPLLHGEAIAIGMLIESYLSVKKGILNALEFEEIKSIIGSFYVKYSISEGFMQTFEKILQQDKKKSGNQLNFTFVPAIGTFKINQNCTVEEIRESFIYYKENC